MTNLQTLNEAFAELARRADAATADQPAAPEFPLPRRAVTAGRLAAMTGTAAVVAGLAVGAVLLAPDDDGSPHVGVPPGTTTTAVPTTAAPARDLPATHQELITRFRAVLGDRATFVVSEKETQQGSTYIAGTLTADGRTGGFSLAATTGDEYALGRMCPDGDLGARRCVERPLPDGSKLIIDDTPLHSGGRDYSVDFLGVDDTSISIHLSNLRDPKAPAGTPKLADRPPLPLDQLVEIVSSELW
jgi:hypothetical protein